MRLRVRSAGVEMVSALAGPCLPDGWSVTLESSKEAVASGPTALPEGKGCAPAFLVETNRSTGDVTTRGALPVTWDVLFAEEPGAATAPPLSCSFPPVLDLGDAASRGIVLVTLEALSPNGPVEVTVDNPTWQPLVLDLPPGSIVKAGSEDWVVGLVRPFDMTRKQKTGRTLDVFPLAPPAGARTPRRLWIGGLTHDKAAAVTELALAVHLLRTQRDRPPAKGSFAELQPFDFWPLVLEWGVWKETSAPGREVLVDMLAALLTKRRAAGDAGVADLTAEAAATEIEAVVQQLEALRATLRSDQLPVPLQACRARFH